MREVEVTAQLCTGNFWKNFDGFFSTVETFQDDYLRGKKAVF